MSSEDRSTVDRHVQQRGRTLIDLEQLDDGSWIATQMDIDIEGEGDTAPLALVDYCQQVAEREP